MWPFYVLIGIAIIVIFIVLYNNFNKNNPPVIATPSPEQKYLVVKIINNTENLSKVYSLQSNQVVCVFESNRFVELCNGIEFSINDYANQHQMNVKDNKFKSYHFYIFNNSPIRNLGLKMDKSIRIVDAEYAIPISILPKGRVSFDYTDISLLFSSMNLTRDSYTYTQFFDELRNRIRLIVSRGIIQFCYENKITCLLLNYYFDEIDAMIRENIDEEFSKFGLITSMMEFIDFSIDETEELKKLEAALLQKQKYSLLKYTYVDEKKKILMDNIKFEQKARINDAVLKDDVKKAI
jgi:hypothetical protein